MTERKKRKVTREEKRRRMTATERMLVTLPSYGAVVNAFVELFGTTERCAEIYIARVRAVWAAEEKADREKVRAELDRSAKAVFSDAMGRGKHAAAVSALRIRAQLNGLLDSDEKDDGDVTVVFETHE